MWLIATTALLGACTNIGPRPAAAPLELTRVPFFSDDGTLCGPSALATLLNASGVAVNLHTLEERIYLPGRAGTLQAELLAGARGFDRLPVQLAPSDIALVQALQAGYAALILQNLGTRWAPSWHYAVVVGYLPDGDQFVLRSADQQRRLTSRRLLLNTWDRSSRWAYVLLVPGELPGFVQLETYLSAAAAFESAGRFAAAERVHQAGASRWPQETLFRLGLGNALAGQQRWEDAARAYRELLQLDPNDVLALNNLATVLGQSGCPASARRAVDRAMTLVGEDSRLAGLVRETATELSADSSELEPARCRQWQAH